MTLKCKGAILITLLFFYSFFCVSFAHAGQAKKSIAVIGGGGAGVTAAWLLDEDCRVTLFEIEDHLGGDALTLDVNLNGTIYPVDAGFEFLNAQGFPYFMRLLSELEVARNDFQLTASFTGGSDRSFVITPVRDDGISLGSILKPHNLLKLIRLKSFFDKARKEISIQNEGEINRELKTIGDFLNDIRVDPEFRDEFLLPMLSSGWGIKSEEMLTWSMENVLRTVLSEPDGIAAPMWSEIVGGTRAYIEAARLQMNHTHVLLSTAITSIRYLEKLDKYEITTKDSSWIFDEIIFAVPPHQIDQLLAHVDLPGIGEVRDSQKRVEFYKTTIVLHGDRSFMPKKERHWSVVNMRTSLDGSQTGMTMYKSWHYPKETPIFKSWILEGDPMPTPLYAQATFLHRKLNMKYVHAKEILMKFQGRHHLWFIGTHTLGDRHENAVISAMKVAQRISPDSKRVRTLWQ